MITWTQLDIQKKIALKKLEKPPVEGKIDYFSVHNYAILTLSRPAALNALSLAMVDQMKDILWNLCDPAEKSIRLFFLQGEGGKAFCAGGDVVSLAKEHESKQNLPYAELCEKFPERISKKFFLHEYQVNHLLLSTPKIQISLWDGVVMGGGVGMSIHGKFRIATENSLFAMPETQIGFFPDVGASYFLPRLDGHLGMYLALTGARLKAQDVYYAGLATHFVTSEKLPELIQTLKSLPDFNVEAIGSLIDTYSTLAGPCSFRPHLDAIHRCFGQDSVPEIIAALQAENSDWACETLGHLSKSCPLSLLITHRMIRIGYNSTPEQCFQMEFRISQRFLQNPCFYEGINAMLIKKHKNPIWPCKSIAEIPTAEVDAFFAPLPKAQEWTPLKPIRSDALWCAPKDRDLLCTGLITEHIVRTLMASSPSGNPLSIDKKTLLKMCAPYLTKHGNYEKLLFILENLMVEDEKTSFLSFKTPPKYSKST